MPDQNEPPAPRKCTLGLVALPDNTYEHDMAVSNKYQNFSAEVLRLSLLGIAAVGFLVTNTVFKGSAPSDQINQAGVRLPAEFRYLISFSLVCLGLSVGYALLHSFTPQLLLGGYNRLAFKCHPAGAAERRGG